MKKEEVSYWLVLFLVIVSSCVPATTANKKDLYKSNFTRREKAYLKVTTVHYKSDYDLKTGRLGLLPLTCNRPKIGAVISDTIGHNLLDTDLRIIERTYLMKILEEQKITLSGLTEDMDYTRIGAIANVDYLLVGTVTMEERKYYRQYKYFAKGGSYTECSGAAARIIDVSSGEVIMSVVYDTSQVELDWQKPNLIGEALATGIKYGLWKGSKKEPIQ